MQLEGVVTNVTAFGAFVDVGVHQDGLVHISELSDRFVKDPREVVKAGDVVKVRVKEVDVAEEAHRAHHEVRRDRHARLGSAGGSSARWTGGFTAQRQRSTTAEEGGRGRQIRVRGRPAEGTGEDVTQTALSRCWGPAHCRPRLVRS